MIQSGQKTVTAAGTAVALGNQVITGARTCFWGNGPVLVKALNGNAGLVYVGNASARFWF